MVALLDVNVLIALTRATDTAHSVCSEWFARSESQGWASCPLTQAGYVRVLSSPAYSENALSVAEAMSQLEQHIAHTSHRFWAADLELPQIWGYFPGRLRGHRQITDAYLLALAIHREGVLVTRDRGIRSLLPEGSPLAKHLLVLP